MNRRTCLSLLGSCAFAAPAFPERFRRTVAAYLERHRRAEGAYGWASDVTAQVTPTFGAVGSYALLGQPVPEAAAVASFVRNTYPVPELRRKERPLWRLDFEQVQTLLWLQQPVDSFRPLASTWTKPAEFTTRYELGGNPVFQHQAMAVRVRNKIGLSPGNDQAWLDYFRSRRRVNATFNATPASDGSSGHLMNTLWGVLALECLTADSSNPPELAAWVRACQLPSGGFTYAPDAKLGAVDDVAYTWAALHLLRILDAHPKDVRRCAAWIDSLFTREGGYQDRPGGEPNPLATYYALESLSLLGHTPNLSATAAATAKRSPIPSGASVFSIQIEAPGAGSPREAVQMAKALGIHLWTAKNGPPGWIEEAQRVANEAQVPVRFHIGDEEYGTYVSVPGLGTYSHLVDLVAPTGRDCGQPVPKKNFGYPWAEFRDTRLAALRAGGGRMIWQFLENEELTRVLLDEAAASGTYAAIASFHFGNENFLHSQPYLHRWYGRIPFVGLQDAHGKESWWWGNQLAGFTTLFIARDPSWESWLDALDRNLVMAVRHDAVTKWKTHYAGGSPEVREFILKREREWRWWDDQGRQARRPAASLVLLRPGMRFEAGVPEAGLALRLRLWHENTGQALPREPRAELLRMTVDGKSVSPVLRETRDDRFYLHPLADTPGSHRAEAVVRELESGRTTTVAATWGY
ncbi:MAG: prenyltransferase/squalene oxidase repeat-containing protein [Bryobacteraceae bacterium]